MTKLTLDYTVGEDGWVVCRIAKTQNTTFSLRRFAKKRATVGSPYFFANPHPRPILSSPFM